ncbi:MAG: hypothetical protein MJ224_07185 [archaeon]|nr:hypothetical protein [archaeon]
MDKIIADGFDVNHGYGGYKPFSMRSLIRGRSAELKEERLQKWKAENPEAFAKWLEWCKRMEGPDFFKGTSFE